MSWNGNDKTDNSSTDSHASSIAGKHRFQSCRILCGIAVALILLGGLGVMFWELSRPEITDVSVRQKVVTKSIEEVRITNSVVPSPVKFDPKKKKKYSNDPSTQFALKRRAEFEKQLATDPVLQFHMTNQAPTRMFYKTATEQALDFIFNTPVGGTPPPLALLDIPKYELDKLPEILAKTEIYDKDEALEVRERCLRMQQVKAEFKKYVEDGGKPREFLNYYYQELERCHAIWQESQRMAIEAARFDDPAEAREFIKKVNDNLAEKGIEPVKLRPSLRKRLGINEEKTK